jgi:eukaryotic-like serine/threonine-protein kinase
VTQAALETPNVPQLVGRYALYGAIASGGMATVHFGRLVGPAGFSRPVAIKRLHAQYARDPEFVTMFLDEARLAARITHPNVVQTLDLVEGKDEVFLVMDYVRGLTLSALVRMLRPTRALIPAPIAIGIVVGMLEGLHAAHEAKDDMGEPLGIVHRDVSPQNVMVGTDGIPRLLDFGVAKASGQSSSTRDGHFKGKLAYMSPEQAQGHPITRRTDIFAGSVVLWELLTGRRLFFGDGEIDSLRRVMTMEVPPPSSIAPLPSALDRVVLKGLEREEAKRYATAHEMALDVAGCLSPASAAEIGSWVERTAAAELAERASLIAAIERSAASVSRLAVAAFLVPGAGATDVPVGQPLRDVPQNPRQTHATGAGADESASHAGVWTSPRRSSSRWLRLTAVGAAVAVVLVLMIQRHVRPTAYVPPPRPSMTAEVAAPSAYTTGPAASPSATSTADSSRVDAATAAAPSAKAAPPVARSPVGIAAAGASPPRPAKAATPPPGPGAKPGCDPPYTEDDRGHIHFKPSCM